MLDKNLLAGEEKCILDVLVWKNLLGGRKISPDCVKKPPCWGRKNISWILLFAWGPAPCLGINILLLCWNRPLVFSKLSLIENCFISCSCVWKYLLIGEEKCLLNCFCLKNPPYWGRKNVFYPFLVILLFLCRIIVRCWGHFGAAFGCRFVSCFSTFFYCLLLPWLGILSSYTAVFLVSFL